MSTKSREVIFGSQIRGAKIRAARARERAKQVVREADRAEAEAGRSAWSYGGPVIELKDTGEHTIVSARASNAIVVINFRMMGLPGWGPLARSWQWEARSQGAASFTFRSMLQRALARAGDGSQLLDSPAGWNR
jgi:hypothetical protein